MIFIAIRILLLNSPISPKKKKRKKKGEKESFERIFQTLTNFQLLEQLNESLIQNHSETFQIVFESISRHVCGVSFSKASIRSNFLETKIYNFLHTHTTKGCTTKKLPVVEVSCCALRPFHPPPFRFISLRDCDLCSCTPLSFCFSLPLNQHGFLSRFIARLSRYWIVQSILTTFVYRCYVDVTEYLRVNQIPFVELFFLSFFFLFLLYDEIVATFSIGWKMVDHLEGCWKYFKRR